MRAAIVYDCLFPLTLGGGERVYRRMADVLIEEGYDVDYLTRDMWSPGAPPETPFRVIPVWSGEIADSDGTRRSGAAVAFARGVARTLRRSHDYDLVIASGLPVLTLLGAAWGLRGTRIPLVADWLEVWGLRKWLSYAGPVAGPLAAILQWVGARVTSLHTANSRFTANRLMKVRPGLDPIELGLLDLAPPSTPTVPSVPPVALAIGRLIPDKRMTVLPAALAVARATVPGLRLVVVGTGPEEEALRAAVVEAGLEHAVDLLGALSDEELDDRRRRATVLVHPSAREGFGLVVAEAASAGVPSVVVEAPENAAVDLVVEGINGFVASSTDAEELGAAIVRATVAGAALRASTSEWFAEARSRRSVKATLREVTVRVGAHR